jgi:PAS domain S-box-containing protein
MSHSDEQLQIILDTERKSFAILKSAGIWGLCVLAGSIAISLLCSQSLFSITAVDAILIVAFAYFPCTYILALRRSHKFLIERSHFRDDQAELLQLTYDAVMVRNLTDGTIRYWNKGAEELYGFTPEEAIGRKSHVLLKTQFPTALEEIEKEAPAVGHWEGELIQTTKDGRQLIVASRWRFKADINGHLSSIMETDVTGRKRHEEEILRAKEEKLEQQERSNEELLELTYDAIMVRNLTDGTIRYWNRGAQDLYGFSSEEAIGRKSHELLKTQFPTALEEIEKEAPAVGHWEGELIQTTKDGRQLIVASRWRFKADINGHLSSIMETDITERKRNEEEILRAKEEKIEQQERSNEELLELTYDAIMVRNLTDGTIRYWNRGAQELYGFTSEEAIGRKSHELLKTQFPTALEEIEKEAPAVGHWEGEVTQTTKDGRRLIVASRWRFKADLNGHLSSIMETDITERKQNEETILKAKEDKLAELLRSNEELQQFAYVCSHDLQEPLRVISTFSQLLSNRYKGKLDNKADTFIDFVVEAAKRMQDLINGLLVFSRIQSHIQEFSPLETAKALEMATANLQLVIAETGAKVTIESLPTIKGDTPQFMQLFQNLLANALKFRSTEQPLIHVSASRQGDSWKFAVKDNGVGLEMQHAERIFVIFQRLHRKEDYPGSGLGLAVCRRIVNRHGGRIWAESVPGTGTTFYFTIPAIMDGELN